MRCYLNLLVLVLSSPFLLASNQSSFYEEQKYFQAAEVTKHNQIKQDTDLLVNKDIWQGPHNGPVAQKHKKIILVAQNLANPGVLGVALGVQEAIKEIGWSLTIIDYTVQFKDALFWDDIINKQPDGVIIAGLDQEQNAQYLQKILDHDIKIIGWHINSSKTKNTPKILNITSDNFKVASLAAELVVNSASSHSPAGVVILTDKRFEIAIEKMEVMAGIIKRCEYCELLEIVDLPLSNVALLVPDTIKNLTEKYGDKWNYTLAINDLYFDYASSYWSLTSIHPEQMKNISAGDGSSSAFQRIKADIFQFATVPEALTLQGWIIIDELNRTFANWPYSLYLPETEVIKHDNLDEKITRFYRYEPNPFYRNAYQQLWRTGRINN